MKTTTFMARLNLFILAVLLTALTSGKAHALVYNDQDLLLLFHQDGYDDVEYDLGPITGLLARPTGSTANVTNWDSSLLISNFGTDLSGVKVILLGATSKTSTNRTVWVTSAQTNFTPTDLSTVGWGQVWSKISGIGNGAQAFTSGSPTPNATIPPTQLDSLSYIASNTGVQPSLIPSLGGTLSFSVEGLAPSDLSFYAISPSSASPRPSATFVGTFHVDATGGLSFTAGLPVTKAPVQILAITNNSGTVTVTFNTVAGANYRLRYTSDLRNPVSGWETGIQTVIGNGSSGTITDTPGADSRYYVIETF